MHIFIFLALMIFSPAVMAQDKTTSIEVSADDALQWDRANQSFTASGNALIKQGADSISAPEIIAKYSDASGDIVIQSVNAKNNAVLKQTDNTLSAKTINADFKDGVLSTVTASDNVILVTPKEKLTGNNANYDAIGHKVIVTGNVKIVQGDNILTGNKAEFDLKTNVSKLSSNGGRVKAVLSTKNAKK